MLTKGDDKTPQANPTGAAATSAPAPTSAAGASAAHQRCARARPPSATPSVDPNALPAGWKLHQDPAGFALPIPDGWVRSQVNGNTVVFNQSERAGRAARAVDRQPEEGRGRGLEGAGAEPRKNCVNNYQYLSIKALRLLEDLRGLGVAGDPGRHPDPRP